MTTTAEGKRRGDICNAPRCTKESAINYLGVWLCDPHYLERSRGRG